MSRNPAQVTATVDVDTAHAAAVTVQLARAVRPDVALKSVKLPFARYAAAAAAGGLGGEGRGGYGCSRRRVEFRGLEAGEYVVRAVASLSTASFRAPPVSSSVTVGDSVPRCARARALAAPAPLRAARDKTLYPSVPAVRSAHAALTFAVTPRVDLDDAPMGSFYLLMAAIVGGYIFVDRARVRARPLDRGGGGGVTPRRRACRRCP